MTKITRKYNKFKKKLDDPQFEYGDFTLIFKTIYMYITETLESEIQINQYVPNSHIASIFLEVLEACEMETLNPNQYHVIPYTNGYNIVQDKSKFDLHKDGLYYKKGSFSISFIDIIDEYFDLSRLEKNEDEIHNTYQKLREKKDPIRNNLKLRQFHIPSECYFDYSNYIKNGKQLLSTNILKEIYKKQREENK